LNICQNYSNLKSSKRRGIMGWSIGFDDKWQRDVGYGVPAVCDFPGCDEAINRGLGYVCGGEPYGGDRGCGLFFCSKHCGVLCERCTKGLEPFEPKPDTKEWIKWKLTDPSWKNWRDENPTLVEKIISSISK
jgi:hypothetical protein